MIRRVARWRRARSPLLCSRPPPQAAVTRAVQAFDTPTFRTVWWPNNVPAQVGDTVAVAPDPARQRERGHARHLAVGARAAEPQPLGVSYEARRPRAGRQRSRHLPVLLLDPRRADARRDERQVVVSTTDPGPPVDPGTPWTDPDREDPEYPGTAAPLPNDTTAPTVFEEGDNDAPPLKVAQGHARRAARRAPRSRFDVSEAGTVTLRLKQGKKVVATKTRRRRSGQGHARSSSSPKRLQDRARRYRLAGLGDRHGRDRLGRPLGLGADRP